METEEIKRFKGTIQYHDSYIWITPVCEFFNLHIKSQYRKIKNDQILGKLVAKMRPDLGENEKLVAKMSSDLGIIDSNGRIFLTKKGFLRWIQIISPKSVSEELRDSFIKYQEMISDFLFGSLEEHNSISLVHHELQEWKQRYSEAGTMIRKKQAQLTRLLNQRYNYRLDFQQNKSLS